MNRKRKRIRRRFRKLIKVIKITRGKLKKDGQKKVWKCGSGSMEQK